jgi:hypothetical protein
MRLCEQLIISFIKSRHAINSISKETKLMLLSYLLIAIETIYVLELVNSANGKFSRCPKILNSIDVTVLLQNVIQCIHNAGRFKLRKLAVFAMIIKSK